MGNHLFEPLHFSIELSIVYFSSRKFVATFIVDESAAFGSAAGKIKIGKLGSHRGLEAVRTFSGQTNCLGSSEALIHKITSKSAWFPDPW